MKDEASAGIGHLGGALAGLGTAGLAVAAAGVAALSVAVVGGIGDAQEARSLYASTQQTITSMGDAAGRSADQVVALASNLSDAAGKSLFGDDQIQQSENLLLTFGNIRGETFDLATALTVDLAQALGGAPADQAMMLGKALNDPVKGMSALGKAGLTFSEEQKSAIKAMQESGDMAGAQALIIAELNKQVGGQAAAAASAAGGMVQFKASMGETFEMIGSKLLPILDKFGAWLNSPEVKKTIEALATALADGIGVAAAWLSDVAIPALMQAWIELEPTVMDTIAFIQSDVMPVLSWLANVIIAGAIVELKAMSWAWQNVLLPAIRDAWGFFQAYILPVLSAVFVALRDDLPRGIALAVQSWADLKAAIAGFKESYIDPIVRGFDFVVASITSAKAMFDGFISGVTAAIIPDWLQGHSPPPMADWFDYIGQSAKESTSAVADFIDKLSSGAIGGILGGGKGGGPSVGIDQSDLDRYLQAVKETGDISNDWLTHMPKEAWNAVRELGRSFLEGGPVAGGNQSDLDRYLQAAKETGDTMNDMLTHMPKEARWSAEQTAAAMLGVQSYGSTHANWDPAQAHNIAVAGITPGGAPASSSAGITVNLTVQGNVTTERDLVLAIRDGLNAIGRQNVTIFGAT